MADLHSELRDVPSPRLPVPERALAISAHPDDAEFGCGGTLARWAAAGCEASLLVITDGSKGTWDPQVSPEELVRTRQREQRESAAELGLTRVEFLGHVDGELEYSMALRAQICLWVRRLRPEVVLGHDPWRRYVLHPDHRVAGFATVDGVVAARDHLFFPEQLGEGLGAHRPAALLLWFPEDPDHWEDIRETLDRKLAGLLRHRSQSINTMAAAGDSERARTEFVARVTNRAREIGAPVGLEAAEAFRRLVP